MPVSVLLALDDCCRRLGQLCFDPDGENLCAGGALPSHCPPVS